MRQDVRAERLGANFESRRVLHAENAGIPKIGPRIRNGPEVIQDLDSGWVHLVYTEDLSAMNSQIGFQTSSPT
jgi:hypothetical protein